MIFHPLHVNPEAPTAADKCWKKAQLGEVDLLSHWEPWILTRDALKIGVWHGWCWVHSWLTGSWWIFSIAQLLLLFLTALLIITELRSSRQSMWIYIVVNTTLHNIVNLIFCDQPPEWLESGSRHINSFDTMIRSSDPESWIESLEPIVMRGRQTKTSSIL